MNKETFIVRTEWADSIFELDPADQAVILQNLFLYHLGKFEEIKKPNLPIRLVWNLIEPNLKRNIDSYDKRCDTSANNGKKGGRPKGSGKQRETNSKPNQKPNYPTETLNDSDTDSVIDSDSVSDPESESEGEKGLTPASAAVSPSANLFPEGQPAEAGTTPSGSAPVSPSKKEVKRKAREDLLGRFLDHYSEWMEAEHHMKPKINGTGVNAGKSILDYLRTSIKAKADWDQVVLEEKELEERILTGWKWFLGSYKKVEPFHQDAFLRLVDINSKFQILYKQARNGTTKQQQQSSGNESKLRQAEGVVATIIGRNRGNGQSSAAGSGEAV